MRAFESVNTIGDQIGDRLSYLYLVMAAAVSTVFALLAVPGLSRGSYLSQSTSQFQAVVGSEIFKLNPSRLSGAAYYKVRPTGVKL